MLPKLHLVSKYEVISVKKKVCPECGEEFDAAIDDFKSVKCWGCNFDSASETADEFDSASETADELFPSMIANEILKLLDHYDWVAVSELPDLINRNDDDVQRALEKLRAEHNILGSDIVKKVGKKSRLMNEDASIDPLPNQ